MSNTIRNLDDARTAGCKTTTTSSLKPVRPRRQRMRRRPCQRRQQQQPTLRFSPTAWAKLLFLRDLGDTEIGAFGISRPGDLLCVEDVQLVRQFCSAVSVTFDDAAVAEFFDEQVDAGRQPAEFARIWLHTHPADSAHPSTVDEETFRGVFGTCDWSLMCILAVGGETYARLQFGVGPGGSIEVPVGIDWGREFTESEWASWEAEYHACVEPERWALPTPIGRGLNRRNSPFESRSPARRRLSTDNL